MVDEGSSDGDGGGSDSLHLSDGRGNNGRGGISLSFPLGDMDDSGRVGDVTASSSVTSSNSGDGGSGKAGNAHGGRGGDTGVAGSNRGNSSVGIAVAKAVGVAVAVGSKTIASIASVQEVGVGLSLRGSHSGRSHAEDSKELVHLDVFGNCKEHYPLEFRAVVIPMYSAL